VKGTHSRRLGIPGGKCDEGESHEDCLLRELREELGVTSRIGREIFSIAHAYPERVVELHFSSPATSSTSPAAHRAGHALGQTRRPAHVTFPLPTPSC